MDSNMSQKSPICLLRELHRSLSKVASFFGNRKYGASARMPPCTFALYAETVLVAFTIQHFHSANKTSPKGHQQGTGFLGLFAGTSSLEMGHLLRVLYRESFYVSDFGCCTSHPNKNHNSARISPPNVHFPEIIALEAHSEGASSPFSLPSVSSPPPGTRLQG